MSFDAAWFNELRGISINKLQETRENGISGYVPHVGELCRAGHVTGRFLDETLKFIRIMSKTRYHFATFFRGYERHILNYPRGRSFRKQWNIAFTAGDSPVEDYVRIGVGFRLSAHEAAHGILEYLEYRDLVSLNKRVFNQTFRDLGNYYEFLNLEPPGPFTCENTDDDLSSYIIDDQPPLNGWRFFGTRLMTHNEKDNEMINSHSKLKDFIIDTFNTIQEAGFGM